MNYAIGNMFAFKRFKFEAAMGEIKYSPKSQSTVNWILAKSQYMNQFGLDHPAFESKFLNI